LMPATSTSARPKRLVANAYDRTGSGLIRANT
jgi:hypothetical protein